MRRLVIGTGNTCRSVMAKALIEHYQHEGDDVRAAGLSVTGAAASVLAVATLKHIGIALSFDTSPLITPEAVAWADEIGVMSPSHKVAVTELFDVDPAKVIVLPAIPDPFGLGADDYRRTRDALRKAILEWVNPETVRIVPMAKRHIAAVAQIERDCFADPWSEAGLEEELHNPLARFIVAEHFDEVRGYLGAHIVVDEMGITNIAVSPQFRRQHVARALLHDAREAAIKKNLYRITLEVRVSNEAAIALYESMGYVKDGIRPRFYAHPTEDAAIYSLYLTPETEATV